MAFQKFTGRDIMKLYVACLVTGVFVLCGCSQRDNRQPTPSTTQVIDSTEKQQPKEELPREEVPDSLCPVHVYTFDYSDPSFPCEPEGGAMIKGFDTDDQGRLYIAGGKPIRLACYNGQHKEYDRVVTDAMCNDAIMSLAGDSILFVEESLRKVAVLASDGTGEVMHYDLSLEETDSIVGGVFLGKDLELWVHDNSIITHNSEEFERNTSMYLFSAQSSWADTICADTCRSTPPRESLSDETKKKLEYYSYRGMYHGMHLYYRHELFLGDIALVDKAGHLRVQTSLAQMPPVNTCCGEDTHIGWFTSSNLYRVKGYSFFLSAYDSKKETISFLEYDLKPLYDFARRMRN